ncbi:MAG: TSUP family transporter [Desulfovibrionaceae bacterium]|nr:TSUP family transporter [Desulfovibrionaceae bacterium]
MLSFLIVCPLTFLAGFIDAIAGGGGLISLPGYMIAGLPVHAAIATNKMSSSMGTAVAALQYARAGFIPWRTTAFCIPCAFLGSACGAWMSMLIPERLFTFLMLAIIPCTAIYVLKDKTLACDRPSFTPTATMLISMIAAFCIGIYDGFYGPGTGTFLILLLTGLARISLYQANGLTKAINLSTNLSALAVFLWHNQVILPLGIAAGIFGIAGNWLGAKSFVKGGQSIIKVSIILVLIIFFFKILLDLCA